jgi:hypothetical protein
MVDATLLKESAQAEKADKDISVSDKVADPKAVGTAAQLPPNHDTTLVQILRRSASAAAALVDKLTDPEAGTVGSPTRTLLPTSDPGPANHEDAVRQQELGTPTGSSMRNRIEDAYFQVSLSEGVDSVTLGRSGAEDSRPLGHSPAHELVSSELSLAPLESYARHNLDMQLVQKNPKTCKQRHDGG